MKHSTLIGGSIAARVVNCPPSIQAVADLPDALRDEKPSIYATEGTALHALIGDIISTGQWPQPGDEVEVRNEGVIVVTQELIHDCLEPAADYVNQLLAELGDDAEVRVETRVTFPGIDNAFGTMDLMLTSQQQKKTKLIDFKFGAGVGVAALYEDPNDPDALLINEQLLFYAAAARNTIPKAFPKGGTIDISICQPRHQDPQQRITTATDVTAAELAEFAALVYNA